MKNKTVYLVDLMKIICQEVSDKLSKDVWYQYGSFKEVFNNLMTISNQQNNRTFPLVWLVTDFKQKKGTALDIYSEADVNILIFNITDAKYLANERTTNSFKATLHPIYEQLLDSIQHSKAFNTKYGNLPHTSIDHYGWGRDKIEMDKDGKKFSDFIDCVEIQNLTLQIYKNNC